MVEGMMQYNRAIMYNEIGYNNKKCNKIIIKLSCEIISGMGDLYNKMRCV